MKPLLLLILALNLSCSFAALASSSGAYNNLDAAVMKVQSSRLFLLQSIDRRAAENEVRKAKLDITKALSQAGKGQFKLTTAKLKPFSSSIFKLQATLDDARAAIKVKKDARAVALLNKAILQLQNAMLPLDGLSKASPCVNHFSVTDFPGVPDVYSGHIVVNCPYIYDEVIGSIAGEIGSLSYGYSHDGRTDENESSCSQNLISSGVCAGVPGRPGGYYRMRMNVYLTGGPPPSAYITLKRGGVVVAQFSIDANSAF